MRESLARERIEPMRMHPTGMNRIGTAGWSLPAKPKAEGTHLYHYARTLNCAEINSTFYRPHRATTWAKWAAETPAHFRFSIKAPKAITHEAKLREAKTLLHGFFDQIKPIEHKQGPILFQLPPSLAFDATLAEDFFTTLRALYKGETALSHATPHGLPKKPMYSSGSTQSPVWQPIRPRHPPKQPFPEVTLR